MGAKINITYDSNIVSDDDISILSHALPAVLSEAMGAEDVFLYLDKINISIDADPIEIFIQVNAAKVLSPEELIELVSEKLKNWKTENGFSHSININVIPVEWHSRIAI